MDTETSSSKITSVWLDSTASETAPEISTALTKLADAQNALAASIGEQLEPQPTSESIEQLLTEAQQVANQIVERAELEALTIKRLMRIEAERLAANVEQIKERAASLER